MPARHVPADDRAEQILGNLLRVGVTVAALVVLVGGVLYLIHYGGGIPHYSLFRGEPSDLRSVPGIVKYALAFRRRGIIQLGLLLLGAAPIARVAFSVVVFAQQRDRLYVLVTLVVLAVLVFSLTGGRG